MKNDASCRIGSLFFVFLFFLRAVPVLEAESKSDDGELPFFVWDLLWAGAWNRDVKPNEEPPANDLFAGGTLGGRADFSLGLPRLDLSFRLLATDKRVLPPGVDDSRAGFNPGAGIYHRGSGSRFLWGVQSEYGLPARVNKVWTRAAPFMESRSPSSRDLKAEPASRDTPESYLYLALPGNAPFGAFVSAALDSEMNPAFGGGIGLVEAGGQFRLEGYYTRKEVEPRKAKSWFSPEPPLPERDFHIYALGAIYNSPFFGLASDFAFSETFAWGRGLYGNFALRLGNRPWRFSLSGDGASERFAGRGGAPAGAGFRAAARGEYFMPRSGLLRFQSSFRSPGFDEIFNRGNFSIYFRPSAKTAAARKLETFPFRFSRASLGFSRDARNPEKTSDVLDALAGFSVGPFNSAFSCSLGGLSSLDEEEAISPIFQPALFQDFDLFKVSGELGIKSGVFDLKARAGHTIKAEKKSVWELSFNASIRPDKWGRLGIKIASPDFPEKWEYTLSWRFNAGR